MSAQKTGPGEQGRRGGRVKIWKTALRVFPTLLLLALSSGDPAHAREPMAAPAANGSASESASGSAKTVASTRRWLLFPDDSLYAPYLADPHRTAFAIEVIAADSGIAETGDLRFGLRVGGDFGLLRSRPRTPGGRVWQFNFLGSLDAQFDIEASLDNIGWDGNFGTSLQTAKPTNPWCFRVGLLHTSAHRGDEYIERTGRGRVGYTREEVILGAQRTFGKGSRGYVEGGWGLTGNADDGAQEPARVQTGWVHEAPGSLWDGRLGWYWGVDASSWEERDWRFDSALQIGLSLPSEGNVWRVALSFADGRPPMGEFFQDTETWVSLGIWLDL